MCNIQRKTMKELNRFRQFLNENEVLDGYDKASRELFDMTWDEVQRENDPRMKQAVHDEVQKDDDLDYIDDVQEAEYGQEAYFEKLFKDFEETKKALIDVARVQLASAAYGYNFDPSQVGGFAKDERKVRKYLRADFRDVKSNMDSYIRQNYLKDKYWEDDPNALFGYLRDNMDYTIDRLKTKLNSVISRNGERLNDPKYKEKYKFQLLLIETIKKTISILEKFKLTIAKDPRTTGPAVEKRGSRTVNSLQEGTWSYGSENDMMKALEEMNAMMMHSDPRQFKAGLDAMEKALYKIFGSDDFHDYLGNAQDFAAEGDLDRAKNALTDAMGIGEKMIASIHGMDGDLEENDIALDEIINEG